MTDQRIEAVARVIAEENGDDYDLIPKNKSEWNAKQGMFGGRCRDVNEPYQCDYDEMARAAIQEYLRQIREPLQDELEHFYTIQAESMSLAPNSYGAGYDSGRVDGVNVAIHLIADIGDAESN